MEPREINVCCLEATQSTVSCYSSLNGLRHQSTNFHPPWAPNTHCIALVIWKDLGLEVGPWVPVLAITEPASGIHPIPFAKPFRLDTISSLYHLQWCTSCYWRVHSFLQCTHLKKWHYITANTARVTCPRRQCAIDGNTAWLSPTQGSLAFKSPSLRSFFSKEEKMSKQSDVSTKRGYYGLRCVPLKFLCWCPNPQSFRMGLHLEAGSLKRWSS